MRAGDRLSISILLGIGAAALIGALTVNSALTAHAQGTAIIVNTFDDELGDGGGDCSLREAVQAANLDSVVDGCPAGHGDDTIILPAGNYTLTRVGPGEGFNVTGDLDMTTGTLTLIGAGAARTIIDGNRLDRVIHVHSGTVVEISGVKIIGGKTGDGAYDSWQGGNGGSGGGIRNDGVLTVIYSIISANATGRGGSTLSGYGGNGGSGGGIFNSNALKITYSALISNATGMGGGGDYGGGSGGFGGGIYNSGTLTMTYTTVASNTTGNGAVGIYEWLIGVGGAGGGIFSVGSLTVTNSSIYGNATGDGGDLVVVYGGEGGSGGGIYNGNTLTIVNTTISRNATGKGGGGTYGHAGHGGGVYNDGELALNSCTISGNSAGQVSGGGNGGGFYVASGTVNVGNSIVANNSDTNGYRDCDKSGGVVQSLGHNLAQIAATCVFTATGDITSTDPILGPLAHNGGATLTHMPQPGSPVIDHGAECPSVDQRGAARPGGLACDIGAVESDAVLFLHYLPIVMR